MTSRLPLFSRNWLRCRAWGRSSSAEAVRVDVNPTLLHDYGLGLEDVRTALAAANANRPKGQLADRDRSQSIGATDQLLTADQYRPMVVTYRKTGPVLLSDIATVTDAVEDLRTG